MKNGKQPAFSKSVFDKDGNVTAWGQEYDGLIKREYFAGLAMQGILASNTKGLALGIVDIKGFAEMSVKASDALLAELEKEK